MLIVMYTGTLHKVVSDFTGAAGDTEPVMSPRALMEAERLTRQRLREQAGTIYQELQISWYLFTHVDVDRAPIAFTSFSSGQPSAHDAFETLTALFSDDSVLDTAGICPRS